MLYASGQRVVTSLDKRQLISSLSLEIPMRDMRWLDPNMMASGSNQILVRHTAIVD